MKQRAYFSIRFGLAAAFIVLAAAIAVYFGRSFSALVPSNAPQVADEPPAAPKAPAVDPELLKAAAEMVAPPYGTALALQVDPRRLRSLMQTGETALRSATSEENQIDSARRIQLAALLGYGPARRLIVDGYPRSRVIRTVSPAPDAVRFALDVSTGGARVTPEMHKGFSVLAHHFSERNEFAAFATHVIEAMRDDPRLQAQARLGPLFDRLSQIEGWCPAVARFVTPGRSGAGAECSVDLQKRFLGKIRSAGPVGREDDARRSAIVLLQKMDHSTDAEGVAAGKRDVKVLPGFYSPTVNSR